MATNLATVSTTDTTTTARASSTRASIRWSTGCSNWGRSNSVWYLLSGSRAAPSSSCRRAARVPTSNGSVRPRGQALARATSSSWPGR